MEEFFDLEVLYQPIKKHFALIIVITFIAVVVSGVASHFFITPIYKASTELIVGSSNENDQVSTSDIQTSLQLISTYNQILTSPVILNKVIEELDVDTTASLLRNQMTVENPGGSQIITLSVQGDDPILVHDIANTTAAVFQREIDNIMHVDNVSILAEAEMPGGPINSRTTINMAIALLVGLMVGVGLAFLLDNFDKTVKTEQDIEKLLELPVVASISTMTAEEINGNQRKTSRS